MRRLVGFGTLLLLLAGCGGEQLSRPDIVLITLDTLRADHLGCYGYFRDTSPNLDALAAESIVFEDCLAPIAVTLPAHTTILTGTEPLEHGILANVTHGGKSFKQSPNLISFTELLADQGYDTAAFVSALPLKKVFGLDAGFQVFNEPAGKSRIAEDTSDRVLEWLQKPREKPFFLWIHYYDPHYPFSPPAPYEGKFETDDALREFLQARNTAERAVRVDDSILIADKDINDYDAEIVYMDAQIARVLTKLRAMPRWDRTVVAVTADHGEGLNQHEEPAHGLVWNEHLEVPFLLRVPGQEPRRVSQTVALVDVIPTLMGQIQLEHESRYLQQVSGKDVLADAYRPRPLLGRVSARRTRLQGTENYCLTTERWKYHYDFATEVEQLYDRERDRFELNNVRAQFPGECKLLRQQLETLIAKHEARARSLESGQAGGALSGEDRRDLDSLGYVDSHAEED